MRTRRTFLNDAGQMGMALAASRLLPAPLGNYIEQAEQVIKGKEQLIVRSLNPDNLETPVGLLKSWVTPTELFYVRDHLPTPEKPGGDWRLTVDGEVNTPLKLSLDDLKKFPKVTNAVTMECAGNGRAFMVPAATGVQWEKGAVGTARWSGVRLAEVLQKAGAKPGAKFVIFDGADKATEKTPDFIRQVPIAKALDADTLLAYEINGEPLPLLHGYPVRVIAPGWIGAYSVKWLEHITVTAHENDGYFTKTAYRLPIHPVAPGAKVEPTEMAPVYDLIVKSVISSPVEGSALKAGSTVRVAGWAWAGKTKITKVEISPDSGATWATARLGQEHGKYTWREFEFDWKPSQPGSFLIMSRATDEQGRSQPIIGQWNPQGYMWNFIDRVRVEVKG
ncbi:MAG: sulfite oxidase [Blastocatellia bacterium]|nr:sulfite oxidase [Blastocatellia bacterium]